MKKRVEDFAFFGGEKTFQTPLHIAQVNLPPWESVTSAFRGIFERRYFANHGPIVRELDARFAEFVGSRHAVCVTNGTIALMILAKALASSGEVIVPSYTFPATVQALSWAGLTPVLCDVDPETQMVTPETIAPHITPHTSGILAVHLWGQPCAPESLESLAADRGISLMFDACHSIGCAYNNRKVGNFGNGEAFSFHATKILSGGEGGCITTNDDHLAEKLRTIRSFHPGETFVPAALRINGKMSEAQAALALLSLEQYPQNKAANLRRYEAYRLGLAGIPGVSLLSFDPDTDNNYQYIVLDIDESIAGIHRDIFFKLLTAENIICRRHFYPGVHNMPPYSKMEATVKSRFPVTDRLCQRALQLPTSQVMTEADVQMICELIRDIQAKADPIKARVSDAP